MAGVETKIRDIIQAQVEEDGFELLHVEMRSAGGAPILRIFIDSPNGITIDNCADTSRKIAVLLDVEDPVDGKYTLEVSSPGIERPLFSEQDYIKFSGKEIKVTTKNKIKNRRKFKGEIQSFEDGILELLVDGQVFRIDYDEIKKANLVYDFGGEKQ